MKLQKDECVYAHVHVCTLVPMLDVGMSVCCGAGREVHSCMGSTGKIPGVCL